MARRQYGTDPYGIIARGVPGEESKSTFSIGRVGSPVESVVEPGRSFGSGIGGRLTIPIKKESPEIKKKAKGGKVDGKCDPQISAFKSMIKGSAKPVKKAVGGAGKTRKGMAPIKKAQGGAAKVRKGMMSPTGDIKKVVTPKKGIGGM